MGAGVMSGKYRYYYISDISHRKCIAAGNAADTNVYHQDHGTRPNAAWCFIPSHSDPGYYYILDRKHQLGLVAGERYSGVCYHQGLTYNRDVELWFPEPMGEGRFCLRDKRHGRHVVGGNRYDGCIYHQFAEQRGNAVWSFELAAMGDEEPAFLNTNRVPEVRRVCHHGHFEYYCGKCRVDGRNCLDLASDMRVVCHHGSAGGKPWDGACASCHVDGANCAIIELFSRVVCHHHAMQSACGGCRIDGRNCLVLEPGSAVTCHHRNFSEYCGRCGVDGKNCKIVATSAKIEVEWDTKNARLSAPETVSVDQIYVDGPGSCELDLGGVLERSRAVTSPHGRPLVVHSGIVAGYPEYAEGVLTIASPQNWAQTLDKPATWERSLAKAQTVVCEEGTWLVEAVCTRQGIDVPFRMKIGGVSYPGVFSLTDYCDVRIEKTQLTTPEPNPEQKDTSEIDGEYDLWGFKLQATGTTDSGSAIYRAVLDPIVLAAGSVEFFRISNTTLEAIVGVHEFGGSFSGDWRLLGGILASDFDIGIELSGFTLPLYRRIKAGRASKSKDLSMYYGGSLRLEWGLVRLTYGPTIQVSVRVLGRKINLRVDTRVIAEIDKDSFSQGIYFKVSAMSFELTLGKFTVDVPFMDIGDLAAAFAEFAEDEVVKKLEQWLAGPFAEAYEWVKYNVTAAAEDAAKIFEGVGAAPEQIAKGLTAAFELDEGDAVAMLSISSAQAKEILMDGFGWTSSQVGDWGKKFGNDLAGWVKGVF